MKFDLTVPVWHRGGAGGEGAGDGWVVVHVLGFTQSWAVLRCCCLLSPDWEVEQMCSREGKGTC